MRPFDTIQRFVAGGCLAGLSPLLTLAVLAVRIDLGSPVLYRASRIGLQGTEFTLIKIRTMRPPASQAEAHSTTARSDPRVSSVGRILRRTKLDEIPQLINIVRGDMVFVGPRPNVPEEVNRYTHDERVLLEKKPGLVDIASVCLADLQDLVPEDLDADSAYEVWIRPNKSALAAFGVRHGGPLLSAITIALTPISVISGSFGRRTAGRVLSALFPSAPLDAISRLQELQSAHVRK